MVKYRAVASKSFRVAILCVLFAVRVFVRRIGKTLELFIRDTNVSSFMRERYTRAEMHTKKGIREQMSNHDGKGGKIPTASDFVEKFTEKTSEQMKSSFIMRTFARVLYGKKCDQSIAGTWTQVSRVPSSTTVSDDEKTTDSLCPLLSGLGAPAFVCGIVDRLTTTLTISCVDEHTLRVVDKTPLTKEKRHGDWSERHRERRDEMQDERREERVHALRRRENGRDEPVRVQIDISRRWMVDDIRTAR